MGERYYIIDVISLENEKEMNLLRFDSQTPEEKIRIPDFLEVISEVTGFPLNFSSLIFNFQMISPLAHIKWRPNNFHLK